MAQIITFEAAGNTNGAALTAANSGFTSINGVSGGNTAVLDAASAASGSFGGKFTTPAGAANGVFGLLNCTSTTDLTFSGSARFTPSATLPGGNVAFYRLRNATGNIIDINWSTTGDIFIVEGGGTISAAACNVPAGSARVRVTLTGTVGTTTSNGQYTLKVYNDATGALLGTLTKSTANLGTTAVNNLRAGIASTTASATIQLDDIQVATGTTTELTPAAPVVIGSTTTNLALIDVRASTGTGTLNYTISPTTGVTTVVAGQFLVPAGVTYTVTATDSGGQSATNTFAISSAATGPFVRTQLRVGGAWTTPVGS